jgi:hypothetical protein
MAILIEEGYPYIGLITDYLIMCSDFRCLLEVLHDSLAPIPIAAFYFIRMSYIVVVVIVIVSTARLLLKR